MMDFLVWVFSYQRGAGKSLDQAAKLIDGNAAVMRNAVRSIDEWQRLALTSQRSLRELAIAFRTYCETPEIDIRDDLDKLVSDLSDAVAVLEEQITS